MSRLWCGVGVGREDADLCPPAPRAMPGPDAGRAVAGRVGGPDGQPESSQSTQARCAMPGSDMPFAAARRSVRGWVTFPAVVLAFAVGHPVLTSGRLVAI
eukprot:3650243-Rhodomonas_salina.6